MDDELQNPNFPKRSLRFDLGKFTEQTPFVDPRGDFGQVFATLGRTERRATSTLTTNPQGNHPVRRFEPRLSGGTHNRIGQGNSGAGEFGAGELGAGEFCQYLRGQSTSGDRAPPGTEHLRGQSTSGDRAPPGTAVGSRAACFLPTPHAIKLPLPASPLRKKAAG